MRNLHLLIIDPQNDFCDLPDAYCPRDPLTARPLAPALPVPGAHADMERVASLIRQGGDGVTGITVTLDSHQRVDIAHPPFWMDASEGAVPPFTQIAAEDVRAGRFRPRDPNVLARTLTYLDALEATGRYRLMVWPVHCELGSWGHNVHTAVRAAYNKWEEHTLKQVTKVVKGTNPWTEHYSALMAEVPDETDPDTQLNRALIARLELADRIYIVGEAGSHCIRATTEHIVEHCAAENVGKFVLLTDCMSPVAGFEDAYRAFLDDMAARGVHVARAEDALSELRANSVEPRH